MKEKRLRLGDRDDFVKAYYTYVRLVLTTTSSQSDASTTGLD